MRLKGNVEKESEKSDLLNLIDLDHIDIFLKKRVVFVNGLQSPFDDQDYGEITIRSAEQVFRDILSLYLKDNTKPIYLFIVNNNGGDFYAMLAVYELIETIKKEIPVYTIVVGYAYSAAAFLFLAGTKRYITAQSRLMYHYGTTEIQGDPKSTERWYVESEKIKNLQEAMLLEKLRGDFKDEKLRIKKIKRILAADTVFSGKEAMELGLATHLFSAKKLFNDGV